MCEHDILSFSRSLIATPPPVGGGVSLEQAAFCSIYTSPATEIVELSIEDVRTRAFAGTFAWSKTGDALSAYGIYHVVNAKLEIVSIKRGDDCNYIVYRDAKQIGGIDCLQINSGCIIKVMDACGGVIALTKINHPHNGLLLKVDIRGASYQFIVASRSSFLDFLWCLSNLFLFWCERWRRLRPTMRGFHAQARAETLC